MKGEFRVKKELRDNVDEIQSVLKKYLSKFLKDSDGKFFNLLPV